MKVSVLMKYVERAAEYKALLKLGSWQLHTRTSVEGTKSFAYLAEHIFSVLKTGNGHLQVRDSRPKIKQEIYFV